MPTNSLNNRTQGRIDIKYGGKYEEKFGMQSEHCYTTSGCNTRNDYTSFVWHVTKKISRVDYEKPKWQCVRNDNYAGELIDFHLYQY